MISSWAGESKEVTTQRNVGQCPGRKHRIKRVIDLEFEKISSENDPRIQFVYLC